MPAKDKHEIMAERARIECAIRESIAKLFTRNPLIPYTDEGVELVRQQLAATIEREFPPIHAVTITGTFTV